MSQPPSMLPIKEAAQKSGMSPSSIRTLIKAGKIVHINTGRKYLINWDRFMEYLNQGERAPTEQTPAQRKAAKKKVARCGFVPPTVEEVAAYCNVRGNRVDPQAFVDFYTSKGWRIGKESMRDWRAAVRTWEKRQAYERRGAAQPPPDTELLKIFNGE